MTEKNNSQSVKNLQLTLVALANLKLGKDGKFCDEWEFLKKREDEVKKFQESSGGITKEEEKSLEKLRESLGDIFYDSSGTILLTRETVKEDLLKDIKNETVKDNFEKIAKSLDESKLNDADQLQVLSNLKRMYLRFSLSKGSVFYQLLDSNSAIDEVKHYSRQELTKVIDILDLGSNKTVLEKSIVALDKSNANPIQNRVSGHGSDIKKNLDKHEKLELKLQSQNLHPTIKMLARIKDYAKGAQVSPKSQKKLNNLIFALQKKMLEDSQYSKINKASSLKIPSSNSYLFTQKSKSPAPSPAKSRQENKNKSGVDKKASKEKITNLASGALLAVKDIAEKMTKHIVKEKDTKTEKDNSPPPPVKSKEKDKKQPSEPQNKTKNRPGWSSNFTKGGKAK